MAIGNISQYQFLQASNPYGNYSQPPLGQSQGYHQAYQAPTTTPVISPSYKTAEEKYAFMENYNSGNVSPYESNPFVAAKPVENTNPNSWQGFTTPQNNGTGELSPNYRLGREDEIIGLDFKC